MEHVRITCDRIDGNKNGVAVRRALGSILDFDGAVGAGLVLDATRPPNARDRCSAIRRAPTSVEPPAGNGTTKRIGLAGYAWACAMPVLATANGTAASANVKYRLLIMVRSL